MPELKVRFFEKTATPSVLRVTGEMLPDTPSVQTISVAHAYNLLILNDSNHHYNSQIVHAYIILSKSGSLVVNHPLSFSLFVPAQFSAVA